MSFLRFAIVFGVLSSSTAAFAGWGAGHQGMGRGMQGGQRHACMAQMDLTPEQTEQMAAIHKEIDPQREKIATEMRGLHRQLRDLNLAKAGADKIKEVEAKIVTARAEQMKFRNAQQAKVDAILTPEQRTSCAAGRGNGMENGMGRGW